MKVEQINKIYSLFLATKGVSSADDKNCAIAIIKKVYDQWTSFNTKLSDTELFTLAESAASTFEVENPFTSKEQFIEIYKSVPDKESITWEDILEFGDSREKFFVPETLINEMERNFSASSKEVLIPEAEKFAYCLSKIILSHPDSHFTLTSMMPFYYGVLKEMFANNKNVTVLQTSIYSYEFTSNKFDLILAVPMFGAREKSEEAKQFICREYDMISVENLSLHLKSDGILSIVLPARITFGGGEVKDLRNFLYNMYKIKEISSLPAGIFSNTAIKTYLFTITTGRTQEVSLKKFSLKPNTTKTEMMLTLDDETFLVEDELLEFNDWNVEHIFETQSAEWQEYQQSDVKKVELGTVADIFRGKSVSKKDPTGNIGVINISNIGDYEIDFDNMDRLEEEERKVSSYLLQDGDILIPARGTAIRVAIFKKQRIPCIASSNLIVIRTKNNELSSIYMKLFLDSPFGRKLLESRQQGTAVINISYKELGSLEIPLPTMEEQKQIADEYMKELELYLNTIHQAEDRWSTALNKLQKSF